MRYQMKGECVRVIHPLKWGGGFNNFRERKFHLQVSHFQVQQIFKDDISRHN